MGKINFKQSKYDADLIIGAYNLERSVNNCEILHAFLNCTGSIAERYQIDLEGHRQRLEIEGDFWNEEELKMHFLSHIFFLADINEAKKIKLFYERILKDEVEGQDIYVKCDCMVATPFGINTPRAPYFFLQQLKKKFSPFGGTERGLLMTPKVKCSWQ